MYVPFVLGITLGSVDIVGRAYPVGKNVSPLVPAPAAADATGQVGLLLRAVAVALDLALAAEVNVFVWNWILRAILS